MPTRDQVHNFAAGPSPLPSNVLEEAAQGLLNYQDTGMGICELSHRGKEFKAVIEGAEADLRKLLSIPDNYSILFTQGGGTGQFSAVVLNLLAAHRLKNPVKAEEFKPPILDYVLTGSWSSKAYAEAQRLSLPPFPNCPAFAEPRIAASMKSEKWTRLPKKSEYNFNKEAAFIYYCENETINGIEFPHNSISSSFPFENVPEGVEIIADYSSSFISRPILNLEKHAIIYAGAQKNLGPSGVTVLIIRNDLLIDTTEASKLGCIPHTPITYEYKILSDNKSLYNTPPTFPIYVSALVLKHLLNNKGGLKGIENINKQKAELLYSTLESAEKKNKVKLVVRDENARSWMNVTFTIEGSPEEEKKFLDGAEKRGFKQLKGHRSVGGIRASIYNAVTLESVKLLCDYINEFCA
ncbi:phosphoserine transaminase [Kwoniella pini CBS 10737]|uniref:phosphoserine transaminase n=1 Tax=Kwoniella pini CBS 10737 TaxID=1296096 RepID=A0A1B9I5J1_9TREE|nr:phosphoserine transaminase [Kwoniella pini CBS 10737]OCF50776.1 phosphoserine transaminase [Kwoniella pini CBS 10737]